MENLSMAAMFLMLFIAITEARNFDIRKYGGTLNSNIDIGKYGGAPNSDISQALTSAFKEACASMLPSKVVIPKGIYKLSPVKFEGPCKAPIEFQVEGTLIAQTDGTVENSWISFNYIDHLTVSGGGVFDGQGPKGWGKCVEGRYCKSLPINLSFNFIKGGVVRDVTTKDSKQFHVNVLGCNNLSFVRFTISAPENSPNTDGIHIGRSTLVKVTDSRIQTGDDCVSLGDGSNQVTVERVTCGPGHGISVGSLGKYKGEAPVVGVTVKNCTITDTQNGVRIKTWPASYVGIVSDIHFEDIVMKNVSNPVVIDQVYCPWNQCNAKVPSKVKINGVFMKNIKGTSSTSVAVKLACSSDVPCQGVEMTDIDLTYTGKEAAAEVSQCSNVQPKISGRMNPAACSAPISANRPIMD